METPSPEAAERETRIRRLSLLHSPMLQELISLSLWMAPLRSTMLPWRVWCGQCCGHPPSWWVPFLLKIAVVYW